MKHIILENGRIDGGVFTSEGITALEGCAFKGDKNLKGAKLNVAEVGWQAFMGCTNLRSLTFSALERIESEAFKGCTALERVELPDGVTELGWAAFYGCTSLKEIVLPDSINWIAYEVFRGTAYAADENNWTGGVLYLGNHLLEAKETAAGECAVRDGVRTIAAGAFLGCGSLERITLPESVTAIGEEAFSCCILLTEFRLPDGVTELESSVFMDCDALTTVDLPGGLTSIEDNVFYDCLALKTIYFRGTVDAWIAIPKHETWDGRTGEYTVVCTDGTVSKDGTVTRP